jgi:streptogramin lyase
MTALHVSETAPTVMATSAPSLPTERATPAHHTTLPAELARSTTPPAGRPGAIVAAKPGKRSTSRRIVLVGLAGLVIVALASGIAWLILPHAGSITEFAIPTSQSGLAEITAGPDGNLWFVESFGNQIGRISPSGTITEFAIPTASSQPEGITAGPDGNLWFTERGGDQIGRITSGK